MIHALILLVMLFGFTGLALAMERHQRDLLGRTLPAHRSRQLRWTGWALILLGLAIAVRAAGPWFGLAIHAGHASVAAGLLVLAMIGYSRWRG